MASVKTRNMYADYLMKIDDERGLLAVMVISNPIDLHLLLYWAHAGGFTGPLGHVFELRHHMRKLRNVLR